MLGALDFKLSDDKAKRAVIAMDPTYKALTEFAQTWGLLFFFIAVFVAIAAYAFWPSKKKKFDDAAPLREDD
jgi:cytochrome c oxidase cbb3-type subunit 4